MPRGNNINNYDQFNESRLRDNSGISPDYFDRVQRDVEDDARRKIRTGEVEHVSQIMPMVRKLIQLQGGRLEMPRPPMMGGPRGGAPAFGEEARNMQAPPAPQIIWEDREKKERIEELALEIITEQYGRIIDLLNLEMDIKLVDPDELQEMKNGDELQDEPDTEPNIEYEESDDEDFMSDVEKRKLTNVITQGAAKNTHRLIHLHKDKIDELDPEIFELMDKLIKTNEAMEVSNPMNIPEEEQGRFLRQFMNGYEKVEYGDEDEEDEIEDGMSEIDIDALINGDEDEMDKFEEEFEDFSGKIKITARATDLTVLLHEGVKGIYEVLGAASLPEHDEKRAEDIMMNTDTLQDEVEDLRYGKRIRQDLIDFVNSNEKSQELGINNFEYVWGAMVAMESKSFLRLFKDAIIDKTGKADRWLDRTLTELIESEREYQRELDEYEREMRDWEESKSTPSYDEEPSDETPEFNQENDGDDNDFDDTEDLSSFSQRELNSMLNDALDEGDMDRVREISKYIG